MDDTQFWNLIEQSGSGRKGQGQAECEAQAKRLTALLAKLTAEEIYDFDRHFARRRAQAYRWDLCAVAYIVNGGVSDDGFEYFCCWLIGQGQAAFEAALASPESIGDLVADGEMEVECEDLLYAAGDAYEQVTGTQIPPTDIDFPAEPVGSRWEEEELEQLYPALCARFYSSASDEGDET